MDNGNYQKFLPFTKMQGIGNDYVYVNVFEEKNIPEPSFLARHISDRHFGVGGDGMVLICPPEDGGAADVRMRMFNADGSEGEMCGNAVRCIGKFVYEKGIVKKETIRLETLGGLRILQLCVKGNQVLSVRVDMGRPILKPAEIPLAASGDSFINGEIEVDGKIWRGTAVSMGNPHFVTLVDDVASLDLPRIGPMFENHPLFPRRVNTEFVQLVNKERIKMRVWERGSGETLACGTGACAALVACALNGLTGREATVELAGGELSIRWASGDTVFMSGCAEIVFEGQYYLRNMSRTVV